MRIWGVVDGQGASTEIRFDLKLFHVPATVLTNVVAVVTSQDQLDEALASPDAMFRVTMMELKVQKRRKHDPLMDMFPPELVLHCPDWRINDHGELVL